MNRATSGYQEVAFTGQTLVSRAGIYRANSGIKSWRFQGKDRRNRQNKWYLRLASSVTIILQITKNYQN